MLQRRYIMISAILPPVTLPTVILKSIFHLESWIESRQLPHAVQSSRRQDQVTSLPDNEV